MAQSTVTAKSLTFGEGGSALGFSANKLLLSDPSRAVRELNEFEPFAVGETADARIDVEDEEAAVILERIVRRGLAQPGGYHRPP